MDWVQILSIIGGVLGGGGAVKMFEIWMASRKKTDAEYIRDYYRDLRTDADQHHKDEIVRLEKIIVECDERATRTQELVERLQMELDMARQQCAKLVAENMKLNGPKQ